MAFQRKVWGAMLEVKLMSGKWNHIIMIKKSQILQFLIKAC